MKKLVYMVAAILLIVSCDKYENGPDFSLHSKKQRLNNNWVVADALQNGGQGKMPFTSLYANYHLNIGYDGQYTIQYSPNGIGNYIEVGHWKFNDDKTHVLLTSNDGKNADYTILRLAKNQLWISFSEDAADWELHLFPKPQ